MAARIQILTFLLSAVPCGLIAAPTAADEPVAIVPPTTLRFSNAELSIKFVPGGGAACWADVNTDGWTDLCAGGVVWLNQQGQQFTKHFEGVGDVAIAFEPASAIGFDGDMRVVLAEKIFKAGKKSTTLTVTFPDEAALLAKQADLDSLARELAGPGWFPFTPGDDFSSPSVIAMDDWLEKPAGKRGGVRMAGDRFELEDGTPIKDLFA